jgi:hypothetical protein
LGQWFRLDAKRIFAKYFYKLYLKQKVTHRQRTRKQQKRKRNGRTHPRQRSEATAIKKASPGCNPGILSLLFLMRERGAPGGQAAPIQTKKRCAFSKESGQSAEAGSAFNKKREDRTSRQQQIARNWVNFPPFPP